MLNPNWKSGPQASTRREQRFVARILSSLLLYTLHLQILEVELPILTMSRRRGLPMLRNLLVSLELLIVWLEMLPASREPKILRRRATMILQIPVRTISYLPRRSHHSYQSEGSAVPVFIGSIDYLHGAGHIRHMLLMGWGGEQLRAPEKWHTLDSEIKRSNKEIQPLGVRHEDARSEKMLWNAELKRILFIDFHRVDHVPRS